MRRTVPVLVSIDGRDRYHVRLATADSDAQSGPSLAEVLDALALSLMEEMPHAPPERLASLTMCPDLELRRVKVAGHFAARGQKAAAWSGRVPVVLERWPGHPFRIATLPTHRALRFPVAKAGDLEAALGTLFKEEAPRHLDLDWLDGLVCQRHEHLELLEIDIDVPTVLSSRPAKKKATSEPTASQPAPRWVPPLTLRTVAVSLAHRALDGSLLPTFGRDAIVEQVVRELSRPGAAVLLVGPAGVGKTAVIAEVVRRMVKPDAPLTERTDFWQLDGNRLIAGMSVVGAWEERVESLVAELHARQDLLVVDDLPTLVWTGRHAKSDTNVAWFLEPYLSRGELRIVGECTAERLAAARDEAPRFFERFRVVQVPPLDTRETLLVAMRIVRQLELDRPVRFAPDALTAVTAFNARFQAYHCQPGAAVTLLRRVADEVAPPATALDPSPPDVAGPRRTVVSRPEVWEAITRLSGLPAFVLDPLLARAPAVIREWFDHAVLAQPNAADAVVDLVCTLQQGLNDPTRPLGTLLLAGPTGVGKTETAKALAAWLFGDPRRLVRFDMSEFGGPGAAARLIGDAHHPDGELTRAIAQQPFAVVLFDEIEKAHPAIFDVLLQVMGEGRLTNAVGRTVDLTSTVILLTSNLGVAEAGSTVGFGTRTAVEQDAHYASAIAKFFKPEFVNRIDRVVPFRPLERASVGALVGRLVAQILERRGIRRSGIVVHVDPTVVEHVVQVGFSATYGARALKRTLENELTVPLARELVARPPAAGVFIDVFPRDGRLALRVETLLSTDRAADRPEPSSDLRTLRGRYDLLRARLDALGARPAWERAVALRSALLAEPDRDEDRLWQLMELARLAEELSEGLDAAGESLEHQFVDTIETETWAARGFRIERHRLITSHERLPVDTRVLPQIARTLVDIDRASSELLYRLRMFDEPLDTVVVRVLSMTSDSVAFARRTADLFSTLCGRWGRTQTRVGWTGRTWAVDTDGRHEHVAIAVRAAGLRPILSTLAGYALGTAVRGPDRIAELAWVEVLPPSEAPLEQQLGDADVAAGEARARRRVEPRATPVVVTLVQPDRDLLLSRFLGALPPDDAPLFGP